MKSSSASPPLVDSSVPALIVKFGRYPLHHGGVGAIRSLGRMGVPVFAITEGRSAPAMWSRYLRAGFVWPTTGSEDADALVEGLLRIGRRIGRPAVLFPTDDRAAVLIAEHAGTLADTFLFPRSSDSGLPRRLADKHGLHLLSRKHGVSSPETVAPRSLSEVEQAAHTAPFPLVAKIRAPYGSSRVPGVKSTTVLEQPDELLHLARHWPHDPGVVLQEYLPREDAEDWIVHGYFDRRAQQRALFTGAKVRSWPPHAGVTTCAFVLGNPDLAALASAFCEQIGFSGIADLDWRYDRRDGHYKLLDFNPRVGAQFRLFETTAGIDVVRAQYLDLTGQPIPAGEQVEGRRFIAENLDVRARPKYRPGSYRPPSRPQRRAGTELAWCARDDLKPCAAMAAHTVADGTRYLRRTWRSRVNAGEEPR